MSAGEGISPELVERMVALVRKMDADKVCGGYLANSSHFRAAQDIVAELPDPVDPDLIEAREMAAKAALSVSNAYLVAPTADGVGRRVFGHEAAAMIRNGDLDADCAVADRFAAIKRGRELERSGK